jgi:hypothetical protein
VYGRVAATARSLAGYVPPLAPHAELPAYASPSDLLADLRIIEASLAGHGAAPLAQGRLVPLIRRRGSVRIPPRRARPAAELGRARDGHRELLARAGASVDYKSLAEPARIALLSAELESPGSCTRRISRTPTSRARAGGAGSCRRHPPPLRRGRAAELRDLEVPVGLRPARSRGPAQGGRAAARQRARGQHRPAVRDDRRPRALARGHARRRSRCRSTAAGSTAATDGRK